MHTKSPWKREGRFIYALQNNNRREENRFSANVQGYSCPEDELLANAILMEAAPDMLELLEDLTALAGCIENYQYPGDMDETIWDDLEILIRKAKGE